MASHTNSLEAAATERKARLAKLASLKRKEPPSDESNGLQGIEQISEDTTDASISKYVSGRNYDIASEGPKLGFENNPAASVETVEDRAQALAEEVKIQSEQAKNLDKPLDLYSLQPRKPNWDLKRDLARKMEILSQRTDNAIARMVRERIEAEKKQEQKTTATNGRGEKVGMEGADLVESVHVRERQEEEDERREQEADLG